MNEQLPPGSDEAVAAGCQCPRMDNGYGRGYIGQPGVYVYNTECPLHWNSWPPNLDKADMEDAR